MRKGTIDMEVALGVKCRTKLTLRSKLGGKGSEVVVRVVADDAIVPSTHKGLGGLLFVWLVGFCLLWYGNHDFCCPMIQTYICGLYRKGTAASGMQVLSEKAG